MEAQIGIMIVDDSAIIRKILEKIISPHADLKIISIATDGQEALDKLRDKSLTGVLNIIILDIEMPKLNGIEALPEIKKLSPNGKVIIASTLSQKGAEITFKALDLGAADYLPKPTSTDNADAFEIFSRDLLEKIRIHGRISQLRIRSAKNKTGEFAAKPLIAEPIKSIISAPKKLSPKPEVAEVKPKAGPAEIELSTNRIFKPEAIAIGSSTGGPEALRTLFALMDKTRISSIPIFVTQHMPPHFTTMLAQNIQKNTGHDCVEAEDDMPVIGKRIYIARGDYHMEITGKGLSKKININKDPQENFCRPAVDPMLRSLVQSYGSSLLVVMLTGMGQDGLKGCQLVKETGGTIFAQDEETSVVWGMPGAVAKAGLCNFVLPINELAKKIMGVCS